VSATAARPLRADAQRNRDALLEAASAAFAENGVDTSLEDVAKRAGVGIGTLYRHFPTRDALIEAAYRRGVEQLCDAADELRATHPGDEALELWMQRFVGYVATKRGLAGALKLGDGDHAELFAYVRARIGDRAAFALDDLIAAAAEGDAAGLDRHYARSFAEVEAIQLLRSAARHFQRLHQVVAKMAAGESFEAAIASLRPPVFWTQRDSLQRQARRWSTARIGRALERLIEAEAEAMRATPIRDEIAQRAMMDIAALARADRR
jgi:AcrR family transcriptional regulator